jgi:hypothetical protein
MRILFSVPAVAVIGLLAVGGCGSSGGSGDSKAPGVASLSQGAAPASTASAAPAQGPQARLDTTQAEIIGWDKIYWQCLVDHGAALDAAGQAKIRGLVDESKAPKAAVQACASKKPNGLPPEMDPDKNPNYQAQWHENVKCLQGKGMPILETPDGWTWNSDHAVPPKNEEQIEIECQVQTFTRK